MLKIDYKNGRNILSGIAGLIVLGAGISLFTSKPNTRPLAINIIIASATMGITNHILAKYYEHSADNLISKIRTGVEKIEESKNLEISKLGLVGKGLTQQLEKANNTIDLLTTELNQIKANYSLTEISLKALTSENKNIQDKLNNFKDNSDSKFIGYFKSFRNELLENLAEKVDNFYSKLFQEIDFALGKSEYISINNQLSVLRKNTKDLHQEHAELIADMQLEDDINRFLDEIRLSYDNIYSQMRTSRVKLRNALNQIWKHKYYEAREKLIEAGKIIQSDYTPKEKAIYKLQETQEMWKTLNEQLGQQVSETIEENQDFHTETNQQLDDLLKHIEELRLQIANKNQIIEQLREPKYWQYATRDDLRIGNQIITYFYQLGIILDRAYSEYHKYTANLYFNFDRNNEFLDVSQYNEHSESAFQASSALKPIKFEYSECGLLRAKVVCAIEESKPKPEVIKSKIPTLESLVKSSKRGFLITGHPGAGKSSAIKAISQYLGDENTMRIALNPHKDDKNDFTENGFYEITELDKIYEIIIALKEEIDLRCEDSKRRRQLIVAVDELGKIINNAPDDLNVMEIIRAIAVEGRKLGVIVLIGNHSSTTKAIEMDGQFREAFYQIMLVGTARYRMDRPNPPKLKQWEIEWLNNTPYPVLTSINGQYKICQHPTHSIYAEYQDEGLPPIGLKSLSINSVAIADLKFVVCLHCGHTEYRSKGNGRGECKRCHKSFML